MAYTQTACPTFGYRSPARAPRPAGTNGMAIAGLVVAIHGFGLPGLGLVGAILGHVARAQIRTSGEDGDGLAIGAIAVGWISTALYLALFAVFVAAILVSV